MSLVTGQEKGCNRVQDSGAPGAYVDIMTQRSHDYVHGYEQREDERLHAQARSLEDVLHSGIRYPSGSRVLEAGCGTGAQTVVLGTNSPDAEIVALDLSPTSLATAVERAQAAGLPNIEFHQGDILAPPFADSSFDHVYVCFVLEHLPRPLDALRGLRRLLRPGGTITVFEGDHGSTLFHPHDRRAVDVVQCHVELQRRAGGNPLIGRELFPLLTAAGFHGVRVSPRAVYADASRPEIVDRFVRRTFIAMIQGVRSAAIDRGLMAADAFDDGIAALERAATADGVFYYTFFKAVGNAPGS